MVTAIALGAGLPVTNGTAAQAIAVAFVVARTNWPVSALVPVAVLVPDVLGAWAGHSTDLMRFTLAAHVIGAHRAGRALNRVGAGA